MPSGSQLTAPALPHLMLMLLHVLLAVVSAQNGQLGEIWLLVAYRVMHNAMLNKYESCMSPRSMQSELSHDTGVLF